MERKNWACNNCEGCEHFEESFCSFYLENLVGVDKCQRCVDRKAPTSIATASLNLLSGRAEIPAEVKKVLDSAKKFIAIDRNGVVYTSERPVFINDNEYLTEDEEGNKIPAEVLCEDINFQFFFGRYYMKSEIVGTDKYIISEHRFRVKFKKKVSKNNKGNNRNKNFRGRGKNNNFYRGGYNRGYNNRREVNGNR